MFTGTGMANLIILLCRVNVGFCFFSDTEVVSCENVCVVKNNISENIAKDHAIQNLLQIVLCTTFNLFRFLIIDKSGS